MNKREREGERERERGLIVAGRFGRASKMVLLAV
jgi:hypothetical protein